MDINEKVKLKPKKDRDCMFSIRISQHTLNGFDKLSNITGYSRNELINMAMEQYLKAVDIEATDEKMKNKVKQFIEEYQKK